MSRKIIYTAVLIASLLFPCIVAAQKQLKEEVIRFNEGLPSDFVGKLAVNDKGFLYLSTRRGLSQYDGYRFLDKPGVTSKITAMAIKDNTIYFHDVRNGLSMMRSFYDTLEVVSPNQFYDADPNNDHFENIFVDSDHRIWCSDFNNVKYFNKDRKTHQTFFIDKNEEKNVPSIFFLEPVKGEIWVFTAKGVFVWTKQSNKLQRHKDPVLHKLDITAVAAERNGIFLATTDGRLMNYTRHNGRLQLLHAFPNKERIQGILDVKLEGKAQKLLYSAHEIYLTNENDAQPKLLYQTRDRKINDLIVNAKAKVIWLATTKGLVKLQDPHTTIHHNLLPSEAHRPGNMIIDLAEDRDGDLYLCSRDNILWKFSTSASWTKTALPASTQCQSLLIHENQVLVSTSQGLYSTAGKAISKLNLPGLETGTAIRKALIYKNKQLWVLPQGKPLKIYTWPELKPLNGLLVNRPDFWDDNLWNDMLADPGGRIWMVGWTPKGFGIAFYQDTAKAFVEVGNLKANADHSVFVGDYYNRITLTKNGNILVSAYGGWNLLNPEGKIIRKMNTERYEVANDRVEGITEDDAGRIWFATEEGLHMHSRSTDKVIRISQVDGLRSDDLIYGFRKLRNGKLAIGIENGFSLVDIRELMSAQLANKLELCAVKINGQMRNINTSEIRLQKGETELELFFSSLSYMDKRKIIYRYKFVGEKGWNYLGHKPELPLSHLAPGNYQILIEAGDNFSNWQKKSLMVNINVPYPFYMSTWFIFLMIALFITLGILVYRYLFHQKELKLQFDRKIKEAEMQALRSQMNPHFMFNTLNSINSFIVEHKTREASGYLTTFAKLMRNILENSKSSSIPLDKELQTLELYLNLEASRLDDAFEYRIVIAEGIAADVLKVPPLILQPFAENAIWHGLRNKEGKGTLEILIDRENENTLHIRIKDNGAGRSVTAAFQNKQFKHKSYGVEITSSRLKMLSNDSHIVIEDLFNEDHSPAGTMVHIYLQSN